MPVITTTKIRLSNYATVASLVCPVLILSMLNDVPSSVIMLKLLLTPLVFLSFHGLNSLYIKPVVDNRLTFRSIEHAVIESFILCVFLLIVFWTPGVSTASLVVAFSLCMLIVGALRLLLLRAQIAGKTSNTA